MTTAAPAGGPARKAGPPVVAPKVGPPAFPPGSAHTGFLRIREPLAAWKSWLLGMLPVLALLAIWVFVTTGAAEERVISPTILPSPAEVIASFPLLWFDRALTRNLAVSFKRVVEGFALAVAVSFPLGVLMGSFTKVKAAFTPLTVFGALPADPDARPAHAVALRHGRAAEGDVPGARRSRSTWCRCSSRRSTRWTTPI